MASLYVLGWRQGSVLRSELTVVGVVLGNTEQLQANDFMHDLWAIVTQDCDLDQLDESNNEMRIEARPLLAGPEFGKSGIRSRTHRFSRSPGHVEYLHSESPRAMVSAGALTHLLGANPKSREIWLDGEDLAALKTWLGRRYDRPAVPDHLGGVMRAICEELKTLPDEITVNVRRVFARFSETVPPHFDLVALMNSDGDGGRIEEALAESMLAVDMDLGIMDAVRAVTRTQLTLETIETSFEVDASDVTWKTGAPHGAT